MKYGKRHDSIQTPSLGTIFYTILCRVLVDINSDKFRHSPLLPSWSFPPRLLLLLVPAPATFTATRYNQQISIHIPQAHLTLVEVLNVDPSL